MRALRADHQAHHGRGARRLRRCLHRMPQAESRLLTPRFFAAPDPIRGTAAREAESGIGSMPAAWHIRGSEPGPERLRLPSRTGVQAMKGDSRVIDYLNKGLRHELT